jgi:ribosomal protein L11 methyltransferase
VTPVDNREERMDRYLSLECRISCGQEDDLAELLCDFDVLGSRLDDAGHGETSATIYLDVTNSDLAARLCKELSTLGVDRIHSRTVPAKDWLADYSLQVQPFEIGRRWWIDPRPSDSLPVPEGRIRLAIEPSMAFGSGTHESTKLALLALEDIEPRDLAVLDVGTGSGILAIAASALGANPVVAIDIDPEAVWVARQTSRRQNRPVETTFLAAPIECLGEARFHLILCNMISRESLPLLPSLYRLLAPNGTAVLSGVLTAEAAMMRTGLQEAGFRVIAEPRLGEWIAFQVRRD